MKKIVKIVAFWGNSGNSGGDGGRDEVLNYNHRGTGQVKTAGDLGEWVPRVPRGIPTYYHICFLFGIRKYNIRSKVLNNIISFRDLFLIEQ